MIVIASFDFCLRMWVLTIANYYLNILIPFTARSSAQNLPSSKL